MKQDRLIPLRVSKTLNAQPKSLTQSEKSAVYFYKDQGLRVARPSWPDLLVYDEETNEATFVEVKRVGDRLSRNQMDSFRMLVKLGFKIDIAIVTPMGEAFAIPFTLDDMHLRIPQKLFFQKRPSVIHRRKYKQDNEPLEVFDPVKFRESIGTGNKEADKKAQAEYDDIMESLNIASRKKDASPPLTTTIEALPEEAPSLERKVRVIEEGDVIDSEKGTT